MNLARQFFYLSINDIRRWDVRIALIILCSIPIFFLYKCFSADSNTFFSAKIHFYDNARYFAYLLLSRLFLVILLSTWLISTRRWWWFFICWPLFVHINDFFYILLFGMGFIKPSTLGFNFCGFFLLPLLYVLRKKYQKACKLANPSESKYKKRSPLLDTIAIWVLCFSVPLTCIYLFFDPALNLDFRPFPFLPKRNSMFNFAYDFFDGIAAVAVLLIWFFESKRWWYFVIGLPILLLTFRWIHVVRHYLDIDLIDPKFWHVGSFSLMIIYPIYKIRGYLYWDIFHDRFCQKKSFFTKFTYLLNSMVEYFVVCTSLILMHFFVPEDISYPLNVLTLIFITIWFLFCRQWWYFLISIPLIWYILKVTSAESSEVLMILMISIVCLYPLYRMRKYVYKEVLESPDQSERKNLQEEKIHKFSKCLLKEKA